MELFLTSTVKHPDMQDALNDYVNGFEGKKMVYIPTAAHSEQGFGVYKTGGTFKNMDSKGTKLEILELEFVTNEEAQQMVNEAEILFLAGGFPVYLSYWLHRRGLRDLIKKRVRDGMYFIGTSAGAMVCGPSLKSARFFEKEPFADSAPGLGYVDFEIWPHYLDEHAEIISKDYKDVNIKPLRDSEFFLAEIVGS